MPQILLTIALLVPIIGAHDSVTYNWANVFPPCIARDADLEYHNGELSVGRNFAKCVENIPDAAGLPVLRNGTLIGTMLVNSSIQLNNLHSVDPLSGTITIDFYWRVFWHDKRFYMPVFWERMPDYFRRRGIDLSYFKDAEGGSLIWVPDVRFHDATDLTLLVEGIRVNEEGRVFWSRHIVASFKQPKIDVTNYPSDSQYLHLRYGSYVYDKAVFISGFVEGTNPISLNLNFDGTASFEQNSLWSYNADLSRYGFYYSSSGYHNTVYHIYLDRQGSGIITRLILPMTMLILLGGVTFWADPDTRVDSTTTLLLAVSAMYIVILANIPLVGYLTNFDKFSYWMFLLLVVVAGLHQVYSTLNRKLDLWPLRRVYLRAMQALGRLAVFPIVLLAYLHLIEGYDDKETTIIWGTITSIVVFAILMIEVPEIRNECKKALRELSAKMSDHETTFKKISKFEILIVNYIRYNIMSTDFVRISTDLKATARLQLTHNRSIRLTDTARIRHHQHRNVTDALENLTHKVAPPRRKSRLEHISNKDSDDEDVQSVDRNRKPVMLYFDSQEDFEHDTEL